MLKEFSYASLKLNSSFATKVTFQESGSVSLKLFSIFGSFDFASHLSFVVILSDSGTAIREIVLNNNSTPSPGRETAMTEGWSPLRGDIIA